MAGRLQQLSSAKGGIDRRRSKGGAAPATLYDLVNGYVDATGSIISRPGTTQAAELPSGTRGLCAFNGGLVVFATEAKTVPAGYTCEILIHPDDATATLVEIHYAGPILGFLYVVAEWSDGRVVHYWLQTQSTWAAETVYELGALVEPTVRNGFAYRAHRLTDPGVTWAPNVAREVGDVVEPTEPNGFEYTVVDTIGSNPRSGTVEPDWPTEDGATINEDTDLTDGSSGGPGATTPPATLPPSVERRYDNPGGNRPNGVRTQAR